MSKKNAKIFRIRLAYVMSSRGFTQKEVCKMAGITEPAMSRYMNGGRVPRVDVLARIAVALGTTMDYLYGVDMGV